MGSNRSRILLGALCLAALPAPGAAQSAETPPSLKIGIAQLALEASLERNCDKIAGFIRQAKERGCRVVVFPETSLFSPPDTPKREIDAAADELRRTVDEADLYALIGGIYKRFDGDKPFERLLVVDPDGRIIQAYNKLWHDARFRDAPGLFEVDGVPCAATLCADRWIRSAEELPAFAGAKVLFECSNNFDNEWIPDLGWYWHVPRALRNEVYVVFANTAYEDRHDEWPGHGHSAVIAPDGKLVAAVAGESDKLIVTEIDLSKATGERMQARRTHPLFKPFWETGLAMLDGESRKALDRNELVSPAVSLKIAAAQMPCSRRIEENVAKMVEMIRAARAERPDAIVFPELAVTGSLAEDVSAATRPQLENAVASLQRAAKEAGMTVAFGIPWDADGKRRNCAVVIGPDGGVLTRYAQVVVDRPELFAPGTSTRAMWFTIKGVHCVVTIGQDALWSEIAEMAALRGAEVHLHLAYGRDVSPEGRLLRKQLWVNLASFRTFTATVNAASPEGLADPSAPAGGGSMLWEDFHRGSSGRTGGYVPHSAVRLAEARDGETILYATQTVPETNSQFERMTGKTNPPMKPWYVMGARVIDSTVPPDPSHAER